MKRADYCAVIQNSFISTVPALEYLFPLAAGFFKAELRFLILFVVPPLVHCSRLQYNFLPW